MRLRNAMRFVSETKVLLCSLIAVAVLGVGHMDSKVRGGELDVQAALSWTDVSPHRSLFVEGDNVRLNYLDWGGDGPPLILIHGIANSPHIFDDLAPLLRDRFHVVAYARRGHGQSEAPAGPYNSKVLVSDLVHLLDNLHIERASFFGLVHGRKRDHGIRWSLSGAGG